VSRFKGRDNGVYCPEWGHAVTPEAPANERQWIYRKLYEAIGETWIGRGLLNHALTILAHDSTARDVWFWSTFGLLSVDVVRGVEPIAVAPEAAASGVRVRLATLADAPSNTFAFLRHRR